MPNHAGFASVAIVQRKTLEAILRVYHTADVVPTSLVRSVPIGPASVDLELFVDVPKLIVSAGPGTTIGVSVVLCGAARLHLPGRPVEATMVSLRVAASAKIALSLTSAGGIQAGLDFSSASIDSLDVGVAPGAPPLSQQFAAMLRNPLLAAVLTVFLRQIGPQQATMTPPLLGGISNIFGDTPITLSLATVRKLSDAIAIAVDLQGVTQGDPNALVDFSGGKALATASHPKLAEALFNAAKVKAMKRKGAVEIKSLNLGFGADYLHIDGTAHLYNPDPAPDFDADFEASARFKLSETQVLVDVFDVDVDIPTWVYVLGFFVGAVSLGAVCPPAALMFPALYPVAAVVLEEVAEAMAEETIESSARAARVYKFTLPGTSEPLCELRMEKLKLGSSGIESQIEFGISINSTQARLIAPFRVNLTETTPFAVRFDPGKGLVHPRNPGVRVRFEARRTDTGAIVHQQDRGFRQQGALEFQVPRTGAATGASAFDVGVRVYQPGAAADDEIFSAGERVQVIDRIKQWGKFCEWSHKVILEKNLRTAGGAQVQVGYREVVRKSKIHRTDPAGRCKCVEKFSPRAEHEKRYLCVRPIRYFNNLPFPAAQIEAHRAELCEYCFYGGPGKPTLKPF